MSCEHSQKKSTNPARRLRDLYDAVSVSLSEMSEVYLASIRDRAAQDERKDNPPCGKCEGKRVNNKKDDGTVVGIGNNSQHKQYMRNKDD